MLTRVDLNISIYAFTMCGRSRLLYEGIDGHHLGHKTWPLESSREAAIQNRGLLTTGFLCGREWP